MFLLRPFRTLSASCNLHVGSCNLRNVEDVRGRTGLEWLQASLYGDQLRPAGQRRLPQRVGGGQQDQPQLHHHLQVKDRQLKSF